MKARRSFFSVLFLFLLVAAAALGQGTNLQSLTNDQFIQFLRDRKDPVAHVRLHADGLVAEHEKCGFPVGAEVRRRWPSLSSSERETVRQLRAAPLSDTAIMSPRGLFKIHYATSGPDMPALLGPDSTRLPGTALQYAQAVASYFDYAYTVEIDSLGYTAPPFDGSQTWYDVYIVEENGREYGETDELTELDFGYAKTCWTSYIQLDNDFVERFYTRGLDAAKVTAAHEFHHMVQLGHYGDWRGDDLRFSFFYEMTSTYYESFVYPQVHDYFAYLLSFFRSPEQALYNWPGYEACLFPRMVVTEYQRQYPAYPHIWRNVWEQLRIESPLRGTNTVLKKVQSDLPTEMCYFARWNYFTGFRSSQSTTERYDAAASYPLMRINTSVDMIDGQASFATSIAPMAAEYLRVINKADTVVIAAVNRDQPAVLGMTDQKSDCSVQVKTAWFSGSIPIEAMVGGEVVTKFYYSFGAPSNDMCVSAFINEQFPDKGFTSAYPDPFKPEADGTIRFPLRASASGLRANLYIYSASMALIRRIENTPTTSNDVYGTFMSWDGTNDAGGKAGTGVYFYTISWNGGQVVGKFAVIQGATK